MDNAFWDHKLGRTALSAPQKALSILFSSYITSLFSILDVSALDYTTTYNNAFTLRPSISVSLSSSDIHIDELVPNSSQDSNEIVVNVESNNASGYVLNSSVGSNTINGANNTSYNNRNLTNTSSNSYIFTSLDYGSSIEDLSTYDTSSLINPNVWGYSYSGQTVTTPTWSAYSGLPLYSDTTNIATLKSSSIPSSASGDNIGFKIVAKASNTQGSGEYTNIINFIAVANPAPTSFYDAFIEAASQPGSTITQLNGYYKMQDMSKDICDAVDVYDDASHIQLIDTRDNEVYWIGKLKDDRCWLLDNLRLGSNDHEIALTPQDTNIETAWILPKGVTSNFNSYINAQINAAYKDDTNVTSYGTASGKVGVYYNYCAATVGTYCYDPESGIGNAQYNICPSGWRMPTGGSNGENSLLYSYYDTTQTATETDSLQHNLSIVLSGYFDFSSLTQKYSSYGSFWSSTYYDPHRVSLMDTTSTVVSPQAYAARSSGITVRCIANNE